LLTLGVFKPELLHLIGQAGTHGYNASPLFYSSIE
jgi:hypothetical protein